MQKNVFKNWVKKSPLSKQAKTKIKKYLWFTKSFNGHLIALYILVICLQLQKYRTKNYIVY